MTKAECVCEKFGFKRLPERDFTSPKHDGSRYTIRVWEALIDGVFLGLHCDNYYGRSMLYVGEKVVGDIESRYDELGKILERELALENFGRKAY